MTPHTNASLDGGEQLVTAWHGDAFYIDDTVLGNPVVTRKPPSGLSSDHNGAVPNTLRPRQMATISHTTCSNGLFWMKIISITISLKFVSWSPISNIPTLVQIMACRRLGGKPLSEPMMIILLTHICVTRPQWVNDPVYEGNAMVTHRPPSDLYSNHKVVVMQSYDIVVDVSLEKPLNKQFGGDSRGIKAHVKSL